MNVTHDTRAAGVPWHLWLVGALALLWNSVGAFDYVMTETRNASYLSAFTPEQLAYFNGFPKWFIAMWALGVWGGVLGSVLLLARQRLAVPVFGVSLLGVVVTFVYNFLLSNGVEVMGTGGAVFSLVIFVVAVALLLYARALARAGRLR